MMSDLLRTIATFKSTAFNSIQPKPYFINPGCFGDDVARWMMEEISSSGISTNAEPGQEDFGWYFDFKIDGVEHCVVIGYRPGNAESEGIWIVWLERNRKFVSSLLGSRRKGISRHAVNVVHGILSASKNIREIRWHFPEEFEKGNEDLGSTEPFVA